MLDVGCWMLFSHEGAKTRRREDGERQGEPSSRRLGLFSGCGLSRGMKGAFSEIRWAGRRGRLRHTGHGFL
jgi:hypothetical protein